MIKAIVPVPTRPGQLGAILHGTRIDQQWVSGFQTQTIRYGRDIVIPPLVLYRIYSEWYPYLLVHTFISDQTLNVTDLTIHRDLNTGVVETTPAILVPISISYGKPTGMAETYLFTKNIDFLLTNYRVGCPLLYSQSIALPEAHPVLPPQPDQLPYEEYHGVSGIVEYLDRLLQTCCNNFQLAQDYKYWTPPVDAYRFRNRLTPERPETILNSLQELQPFEYDPTALLGYVNDLVGVEQGVDPHSILTDYLYFGPYDPITTLCLDTPTYLTVDQLANGIEDPRALASWYQEANWEMLQSQDYICNSLLDRVSVPEVAADPYLQEPGTLESLLETLYSCYFPDVTLWYKDRISAPEISLYDRFLLGQPSPFDESSKTFREAYLVEQVRRCFMNPRDPNSFDELHLAKTWLGELFIYGIRHTSYGDQTIRYYLNLDLYHLISPSLVNLERLKQVQSYQQC